MSLSYTAIRDLVEQILQDSGNVVFLTSELDDYIANGLREFSDYAPYKREEIFTIEARSGQATATSALALIDSTNSPFLSTDVDKEVYNFTDRTHAIVTSYSVATQVAIDKDIFVSGEGYQLFNKGCSNTKQINIENLTDMMEVLDVYYPLGTKRNFSFPKENIIEINTNQTMYNAYEASVLYNARHRISQLTTFTGAVANSAGYAAAATSMALDALQTSGTVEEDQEFTVAGIRGTYRIADSATIASSTATISFYPGLQSAATDNDVVTFKKSSFANNPKLERLFCGYVAANASINKRVDSINQIAQAKDKVADVDLAVNGITDRVNQAIADLTTGRTAIGNMSDRITQAINDLASGRGQIDGAPPRVEKAIANLASGLTELAKTPAIVTLAETAIGKIDAEIVKAKEDLTDALMFSGRMSLAGKIQADWFQKANGDLNVADGFLKKAQGNMAQAREDESIAGSYGAQALRELNAATKDESIGGAYAGQGMGELKSADAYYRQSYGYNTNAARELQNAVTLLSQAGGYLRELQGRLTIAGSGRYYQEWGERKLALTLAELRKLQKPRITRNYPKGE